MESDAAPRASRREAGGTCRPARAGEDRCPGVLRLHEAADGALARVRLPGGRIDARQLDAIAAAAAHGSGLVELTGRANMQLRGLPADAGAALAELLFGADLLPSLDHDRARNVLASPLAGRGPGGLLDTDPVIAALDRGLCADPALAALSGRFLFAVDDGGGLALGHGADVTLAAVAAADAAAGALSEPSARAAFALLIGGAATDLRFAPQEAAPLALRAARAFLDEREQDGGGAWRVRELPDGAARVARRLGVRLATEAVARGDRRLGVEVAIDAARRSGIAAAGEAARQRLQPGTCQQRDGRVAMTALAPLGRLEPGVVRLLAALVRAHGDGTLRLSPWRSVTLLDVEVADAAEVAAGLAACGLVVAPASGWGGLSACAGLGACANARVDVRAAAARRAAVREDDAPAEHWAACERRCGETRSVAIAVAAGAEGLSVSVGDAPERTVGAVDDALTLLAAQRIPA